VRRETVARRSRLVALESVFVGIGLSLPGMIAAALGYLAPVQGALLQEAIDVAVVLNALRALGGHKSDRLLARWAAIENFASLYACFFLYTMHQPYAAIVPSTFLQDEGASNSSQLSQRCSPFGVSWYFTIFCDTLAACAAVDVPMTAVAPAIDAPAALAAMVKTCRREIPRSPVMTSSPVVRANQ
jgi:hypothetical protein